tara:strand:+ start:103 stop:246 length:144 start_codon:yes stop_codon:yes gene_type:complete
METKIEELEEVASDIDKTDGEDMEVAHFKTSYGKVDSNLREKTYLTD